MSKKDMKLEQMVQEEDANANFPMECQGAIVSDEVTCRCDLGDANELQNLVGESLKMGRVDHHFANKNHDLSIKLLQSCFVVSLWESKKVIFDPKM